MQLTEPQGVPVMVELAGTSELERDFLHSTCKHFFASTKSG